MQTEQNKQAKKLLIMYILEVLKRHSDDKHTLSQKEIMRPMDWAEMRYMSGSKDENDQ